MQATENEEKRDTKDHLTETCHIERQSRREPRPVREEPARGAHRLEEPITHDPPADGRLQ